MSSLLSMLLAYLAAAPLVDLVSAERVGVAGPASSLAFSENPLVATLTLIGLANIIVVVVFAVVFLLHSRAGVTTHTVSEPVETEKLGTRYSEERATK